MGPKPSKILVGFSHILCTTIVYIIQVGGTFVDQMGVVVGLVFIFLFQYCAEYLPVPKVLDIW